MSLPGEEKIGAIKLCCSRSCPTVTFKAKEEVVLTDDFGGKVTLTEDNLDFLIDEYRKHKEEKGA